jgi:hypothetical protein
MPALVISSATDRRLLFIKELVVSPTNGRASAAMDERRRAFFSDAGG